ncbi:MAG: vitamin K epoxide reductase family protein [bacterium]
MHSRRLLNWLVAIFLVLSFIGFADASFLTISHYTTKSVPCVISSFDCNKVTSGPYSTILGIPVALFGVGYYLILFVMTLAYLDRRYQKILLWASRFTIVGLIMSLWFIFLMAFIIKAFCLFCLVSAFTSIALFILGLCLVRTLRLEQVSS